MEETTGIVLDIKSKGHDCPTIATIEYQVNGIKYIIKESLKLKSQAIKIGVLPVAQKLTPKVKCIKGECVKKIENKDSYII